LQEIEARFVVLPITGRACARALDLPAAYPKDPADRIIGATALVEGLSLLTADPEIRRSKVVHTIW
jgi:PIN domain nuclease of toxin-antitoxin system